MREIRCKKCNKLLAKADGKALAQIEGCIRDMEYRPDHQITLEIQCPHNYRENGKNVQCKTLNEVVI